MNKEIIIEKKGELLGKGNGENTWALWEIREIRAISRELSYERERGTGKHEGNCGRNMGDTGNSGKEQFWGITKNCGIKQAVFFCCCCPLTLIFFNFYLNSS